MQLKDSLAGIVPAEALRHLSNRFEVIGDIAILSLRPELEEYKYIIAETILRNRRNIYTVLNKITRLSGNERTARYEMLAGNSTITIHHEFGFEYRLDVSRSFFNTKMAFERVRVTDQVEPGESVLIPFAGVGPFAIPAAAKGANVLAIEKNPDAVQWLKENIHLNKVHKNITVIEGDAFDTNLLPNKKFDRAIIPTPYSMDSILDILAPWIAYDGMIHFYTFKKRHQIPGLVEDYRKIGFDLTYYNTCGNVAPRVNRWVFDMVNSGRSA
jgi:tRNA (guanine37-N1)-methyltransferase